MLRFFLQFVRDQVRRSNPSATYKAQLQLETLDERIVPSSTPTVDLTTAGAEGMVNGAIFQQGSVQPAGSGVIHAFVRIHGLGGATSEQGYNTDARPLQFDENKSPTFTRSIHLSDIPEVNIGGVSYRAFLLDINQKASEPLLSLDQVRIYEGNSGNLTGYDTKTGLLAGMSPLYDLNAGSSQNWVELNGRLAQGLGKSDMTLYVPDSYFLQADTSGNPDPYVYLFSRFGDNIITNGGFEQWAVQKGSGAAPASLSGYVTQAGSPLANQLVELTGFDTNHNSVTLFAVTNASGFYSFDNLSAGTYTVSVVPLPGNTETESAGTLGGTVGTDMISAINLGAGQNGLFYNFDETRQLVMG
jgi:hypothetical protein